MNIFILGTGRCGTTSFIEACKHITNFTAAHESRSRLLGEDRLNYPTKHIEADNRLSWFLGGLHEKYQSDVIYVHMTRDRDKVAKSFNLRWGRSSAIIDAFTDGILMTHPKKMTNEQRLQACYDYVDTVTTNIRFFLKSAPGPVLDIKLETVKDDFKQFWETIGAQGDLDAALAEFDVPHNASTKAGTDFKQRLIQGWRAIKP